MAMPLSTNWLMCSQFANERHVKMPCRPVDRTKKHMPDPRNIAHDKKVQQEKLDHGQEVAPDAAETPQPGRKPRQEPHPASEAGEAGAD